VNREKRKDEKMEEGNNKKTEENKISIERLLFRVFFFLNMRRE